MFRQQVPDRLIKMIEAQGFDGPLAKQFLYSDLEKDSSGLSDPIGDHAHQKTAGLVHRYKNRALLFPTQKCPVHCRYCFRRNELETGDPLFGQLEEAFSYLDEHDEIEEVILSGGDPLTLSEKRLDNLLSRIKQQVRIHSRVPVSAPESLSSDHLGILEKYDPILVIHTNHSSEWDDQSEELVSKMKKLRLFSQTVLLKGVNDNIEDLVSLFKKLSSLRMLPYYLHHPDQVMGAMHFWLSLEEGRRLYAQLRDQLSGWQLPRYVIDIPGGHGKVDAFNPEAYSFSGKLIGKDGEFRDI